MPTSKDIKQRKKIKPYFDELMINRDGCLQMPEISEATGVCYGTILMYFSEYMRDRQIGIHKPEPITVKAIFLLPDKMIQVYGSDNKLIQELCGKDSIKLRKLIDGRSDENTKGVGY